MQIESLPSNGEAEITRVKEQKDRVVREFLYGDELSYDHEISDDDVNKVKQMYIDMGENDSKKEELRNKEIEFLKKVPGPMETSSPEMVRERLTSDAHVRKIIGYDLYDVEGFKDASEQELSIDDLNTFYNKYQTPADYQETSDRFLNNIKENNSQEKYDEYKSAMEDLKNGLYGEREEYWTIMQDFARSAQQIKGMISGADDIWAMEKKEV